MATHEEITQRRKQSQSSSNSASYSSNVGTNISAHDALTARRKKEEANGGNSSSGSALQQWGDNVFGLLNNAQNFYNKWRSNKGQTKDTFGILAGHHLKEAERLKTEYSGDAAATKFIDQYISDLGNLQKYSSDMLEFYSQFADEDEYNKWKNDYELDNKLKKKYEGQSYTDLRLAMGKMNPNDEEYKWLDKFAPSAMNVTDYDRLISQKEQAVSPLKAQELSDFVSNYEYETPDNSKVNFSGQVSNYEAEIEKLKAERWMLQNAQKYGAYSGNSDFKTESAVVDDTIEDKVYRYINNLEDEVDVAFDPDAKSYEKYDYMTEDEKATYNYIYNVEGRKAAEDYLNYLEYSLDEQRMQDVATMATQAAKENPFAASLYSTPANLMSGAGFANIAVQNAVKGAKEYFTGEYAGPINYNTQQMNNAIGSQAIRKTIAGKLAENSTINLDPEDHPIASKLFNGKSWGDVYQLGMSMVDSAAVALLTPILGSSGTLLLGGSAATQSMLEALERGASDTQALTVGLVSGAAEALFENIGIDNLVNKIVKGDKGGILRALTSQAAAEGFEEVGTSVANNIADYLIMAENSGFSSLVSQYVSKDMSEEEAIKQALKDIAIDLGWDFVGGLASGGIMGMGGYGIASVQAVKDSQAKTKEAYAPITSELIAEALDLNPGNKFAQKMQDRVTNNKELSGADYSKLIKQNEKAIRAQDTEAIQKATVERLTALGEKENVELLAKALAKQASGKTLNDTERSLISNSKYGQRVANELNPKNVRSGEYSSSWVSNINTERINTKEYNPKPQTEAKAPLIKSKFTVSDTGTTINTNTGKEVRIERVKTLKDGKMTLDLSDGSTVPADDVAYATNGEALIYETVASLDTIPTIANELINGYKPGSGVSPEVYARGIQEAFVYGQYNLPMSQLMSEGSFGADITEDQRHLAYKSGQKFSGMAIARQQAEVKKGKVTVKRTATSQTHINDFNPSAFKSDIQRASYNAAKAMGEVLGVDIYLYESYEKNGKRVYINDNGMEVEAPNGYYHNGAIHIDINAGDNGEGTMLFTLSHELTHFIRQWSPTKFKVLANFLNEQYGKKGVSIDYLVRKQQEKAKAAGRTITYDEAYEEFVADSMETMLTDGKVAEKLAQLKHTDESLWAKIKEFFNNLYAKVKEYYAGLNPNSEEGKYVSKMVDALEQIQSLFAEGLAEASANYQGNFAPVKAAVMTGKQYSFRGVTSNKKSDIKKLATAQDMLASGIDSEKVRLATGWFRGYDGKWRNEIDDSGAKLRTELLPSDLRYLPEAAEEIYWAAEKKRKAALEQLNGLWGRDTEPSDEEVQAARDADLKTEKEVSAAHKLYLRAKRNNLWLSDILDHPKLYKAYPSLKTLPVSLTYQTNGKLGSNSGKTGGGISIAVDGGTPAQLLSTIMHEVQHEIQNIEGFAKGSNPDYWAAKGVEEVPEYREAKATLDDISKKLEAIEYHGDISTDPSRSAVMYAYLNGELVKAKRGNLTATITHTEQRIAAIEARAAEQGYSDLLREYLFAKQDLDIAKIEAKGKVNGYDLYYRTAGEVEARDVQSRLDLSEKERKATRPDIDRTNVVFMEGQQSTKQFEIRNLNGELLPVLDTQNDTRDYKVAEAYLKTLVDTERPFATVLVDSQPVYIGKDLPGEYKSSEYTKSLKSTIRAVKMQAATNLDEMILLAENGEWRENVKEKHKVDAQNGWYRYDTQFAVPILDAKKAIDHYTVYGGTLLIRNDADGKSYLYDLIDIQKKKVISKTTFSAQGRSAVTSPKPSDLEYTEGEAGSQVQKQQRATMTAARIDDLIADSGAGSRTDYAQKWITAINPTDFLNMTLGKANQDRAKFDTMPGDYDTTVNDYDFIEGGLKKSRQTPYLAIDVETGKVVGHEGRHRMRALEKAGVTYAEIVIEFRDEDGRTIKELNGYGNSLEIIDSLTIRNQVGTGQAAAIKDIIPLNKANRDAVFARYGAARDGDIKYQSRGNANLEKVNAVLEKQNAKLSEDVKELKDLLKIQKSVTGGMKLTPSSVETVSKKLMRDTHSKGNVSELKALLNTFYEELRRNDSISLEESRELAQPAVDWLHNNMVSEEAKQDATAFAYESDLIEQDIFSQVLSSYWDVSTLHTVADVKQKQINKLKTKHNERVTDMRKTHKEELASLKKQHKEEVDRIRTEAKQEYLAREQEIIRKYQESRMNSVEGRKKTAEKAKIRKKISALNKLLNRGTKERNVKEGMQETVAQALKTADILFTEIYSDNDMIRDGIQTAMTADEQKYMAEARALLERISKLPANSPERAKLEGQLSYRKGKLRDVLLRERARIYDAEVTQALKDLAEAYKKLPQSQYSYISEAYDPVAADVLSSITEELEGKKIRDMTLEDLERVNEAYTLVLTTIRNANKSFAKGKDISEMGDAVVREVRKISSDKKLLNSKIDAIRKFGWNNLKPVYAFKAIGSDTLSGLFNNIRAGEDTWARDVFEAKAFFREQANKNGYDSWDLSQSFDFTSTSGLDFSLTLEQIMSLYAFSKRDQALDHLQQGGIVFDENTEVEKKGKLGIKQKYRTNDATAYNISADLLTEIVGKLSPKQIAFVDAMQDYLSNTMGAKGNEVSMEMYGIKLFKEKNYFPLKSAGQYQEKAKESEKNDTGRKLKNSGFTKATKPKAGNPIVLSSFMDVWSKHVNDMSMYHAFVLPMEDFYKVYNYKTPTAESFAIESVNAALQNAYTSASTEYIDQLLKDLAGGARRDSRESVSANMLSKFKKASTFASLSVVIQQPSAIGRAFAYIDPKYFVGSKADSKKHSAMWEEVKKYAPVAMIKEMGYFDMNMGHSTQDFIKAKEYAGFKEKVKGIVTDETYRDDKLSRLPALADEMAWGMIWEAVKRETRATRSDLTYGSEAFLEAVGKRFTEVIVNTQVYDSVLSRSSNMRSKGFGAAMLTSFMAEPTTTMNMVLDGILQGKRGNKTFTRKVIGAAVTSVILNAALVSIVYAMRDDDENETFLEKYLSSFAVEVLDGLNPLTYFPVIRDIWSLLQGYDIERSDMALISDLIKSVNKTVKVLGQHDKEMTEEEQEKWLESLKNALWGNVDYITALTGIPEKNIRRDIKAVFNFFNTISADITERDTTALSLKNAVSSAMLGSLPIVNNLTGKSKKELLYEAMVSGDEEYTRRLVSTYSDASSADSAVRSVLRNKDSRIHAAAVARINGDTEEYKRLARSIVAEGSFDQDTVVLAINAEITALSKTEDGDKEEKAIGFYKPDDFADVVASGNVALIPEIKKDIVDTYVANGKTAKEAEESFISNATSSLKEKYLDGGLTETQAINALTKYCGKAQDAAEVTFEKWEFRKEHGFEYSEREDKYLAGEITEAELKQIIIEIEGKDPKEAEMTIEVYDWHGEGLDYATEASVKAYNEHCASFGISKLVYLEIRRYANQTDNDIGENGKPISYSAMKKIMAYINQYNLSAEEKTAIAESLGWSAKNIKKYKLW